MKIYNSQLVMSLVYRSTIKATTTAQRDAQSPLCLAFSALRCNKKRGPGRAMYFIVVQERQSLNRFFVVVF